MGAVSSQEYQVSQWAVNVDYTLSISRSCVLQHLKQFLVLCDLLDHILEYCMLLLNVSTQVH
jgi:hypothetical protein